MRKTKVEVERAGANVGTQLRIFAMAPGDAFDPRTNSGVSRRLFTAMSSHVDIVGTVSCLPSKITQQLIRLRSFAPTKSAWRSRYRLSMYQVRASGRAVAEGLDAARERSFDAFFAQGTYCNVADFVSRPVFPYVDHDLPSMIAIDPRMQRTSFASAYVRRRLQDEKRTLESAARVFTFSEWCRQRIAEHYRLSPAGIECVGAGSNIPEQLLEAEPDYAGCHAVFIGFDFERKGGPTVLRAFSRLREQLPSARLTLIGATPRIGELSHVRSLGPIVGPEAPKRLANILASGSIFVMPSVFEPFGIAFLEAMAAGLPCIGSDRCAMPEIIGDTGAIVPPGDSGALARRMYELLSDPAACRERGRAARLRYRETYGWDKVAARIASAMERTITSR